MNGMNVKEEQGILAVLDDYKKHASNCELLMARYYDPKTNEVHSFTTDSENKLVEITYANSSVLAASYDDNKIKAIHYLDDIEAEKAKEMNEPFVILVSLTPEFNDKGRLILSLISETYTYDYMRNMGVYNTYFANDKLCFTPVDSKDEDAKACLEEYTCSDDDYAVYYYNGKYYFAAINNKGMFKVKLGSCYDFNYNELINILAKSLQNNKFAYSDDALHKHMLTVYDMLMNLRNKVMSDIVTEGPENNELPKKVYYLNQKVNAILK